ncbi:SMP-30/gluconolactonase/LRE family protein [Novosphingobium album (ex Hu et al. 2023)]|uniref:SMP-30/gluconolactonase/LRE family protein n=1 Tax=Novosphingobium album (ex Hu et al. 2023) TaxID=2930093 RepID=A0ABT0B221_9SPHN|nr:SMP-30/gluconolactonase/LRE family protein [Novosphingobium album (ex Hu et al. 2023)]MCJ2178989.1 SMP-30/gluconolactonase/LRE family protein [Novosphingobium album (ex Hu et al. 2023)]
MTDLSAQLSAMQFEKLATGIYLEGLAVDHERDVIWYSDVVGGGIHGVKPDGTPVGVLDPERMWTGGILINSDGAVLSSGQGGVRWNNPQTGASGWLIEEIGGEPVNGINEMWPDGTGGMFFGTIDMENIIAARDTRPTALYRLTREREVIPLAEGLRFTNGIACNPARGEFYCSETFGKGLIWDMAPDLTLSNKRMLLDRDDCDGLALDVDDNIWIPGVYSPNIIRRVTPAGQELDPIPTPPGATTQVRFGGKDGRDIYIVLVPEDAGDCLKNGRPLSGTSALWRGRSPVAGVKVPPADFALI